jgi:hypothetical protein
VEVNAEPPAEQEKIDRIFKHVKYHEKESKVVQKLLENHNREIGEAMKGIKGLGVKLAEITEAIRWVIYSFKRTEQRVIRWEEKQQVMLSKINRVEEERRK